MDKGFDKVEAYLSQLLFLINFEPSQSQTYDVTLQGNPNTLDIEIYEDEKEAEFLQELFNFL